MTTASIVVVARISSTDVRGPLEPEPLRDVGSGQAALAS